MSRFQIGILISIGLLGCGLLIIAAISIKRPEPVSMTDISRSVPEPSSTKPGMPSLPLVVKSGPTAILVRGNVQNSRGEFVEGADVQAVTFDGRALLGGRILTDEAGKFQLQLPPGRYSIYARRTGVGSRIIEPLEIQKGAAESDPLELILLPDIQVPFSIVQEGSDLLISGMEVSIARLSKGKGRSRYSVSMGKWTSDGKKPVVVVGLSEGAFQVVFSGRGYEGRTEFFQIRGGECSHPLPWTVKMRPLTYRIIFLVTDEGNVPLSRIQVVVKGRKPVYSDIRGRVTVDQLRDGIHEAVFSRKGYLSTRASFRFQGGVCSLKLPHPVKLQKLNSDE